MISINFQLSGNPKGQKLVLLNGLFADLKSYEDVLPMLKDEFYVLRYDTRGQGETEHPVTLEYSLSDHVADLKKLLDNLKWEKSLMVGISNGARIALSFAENYPDRVGAIVAADTYDEATPLLKLKFQSWLRASECGGPLLRYEIAAPWVWGESLIAKNPTLFENYRAEAAKHPPYSVKALLTGAMKGSVDVSKIDCPVYLMCGDEDLLTPHAYHARMLPKLKLGKLDQVPGGHASLLEHPEIFKTHIIPFLRGL